MKVLLVLTVGFLTFMALNAADERLYDISKNRDYAWLESPVGRRYFTCLADPAVRAMSPTPRPPACSDIEFGLLAEARLAASNTTWLDLFARA